MKGSIRLREISQHGGGECDIWINAAHLVEWGPSTDRRLEDRSVAAWVVVSGHGEELWVRETPHEIAALLHAAIEIEA